MTFNWKDYLTFAENIYDAPELPGPREAALRAAVSRAYYAAFCASVEFGQSIGFYPSKNGEDHESIRKFFREMKPESSTAQRISVQLNRLHDNRKKADYRNTMGQKPEVIAYYSIHMAREIFQFLEELSQ
jgi:uncharacterized protein (UPF0332 family)